MTYTIVGLGNPGEEHEHSRHNIGRMAVEQFAGTHGFPEWKEEKKKGFLISKGAIGKHAVDLVLPQLFMNRSGAALKPLIGSAKKAATLVVVYDDIDLPFGVCRISFGRGSGGHRGVESVIKALKTRDFIRVRVGISPQTSSGKMRKPKGEDKVVEFLLKPMSKKEHTEAVTVTRHVGLMLDSIIEDGYVAAMNQYN